MGVPELLLEEAGVRAERGKDEDAGVCGMRPAMGEGGGERCE